MTVRVGFLGAGLIATYHSKSLHRAKADVVWTGVYDTDAEHRITWMHLLCSGNHPVTNRVTTW